jgi:hypothetical protein
VRFMEVVRGRWVHFSFLLSACLARLCGGGSGCFGGGIRVLLCLEVQGVALTRIQGVVLVVAAVMTALAEEMAGARVVVARVGIGDGLRGAGCFDDC